jgi:hypothetical protein
MKIEFAIYCLIFISIKIISAIYINQTEIKYIDKNGIVRTGEAINSTFNFTDDTIAWAQYENSINKTGYKF